MGVGSGRTRIPDLSFEVFGRTLHPDWFGVRAHRRIAHTMWEADLRIIEGGHAILWACGPVRISEVLSGPQTALPEAGLLFHSNVRNERTTSIRPAPGVEYQTCFAVERLDHEVFGHLAAELTLSTRGNALTHRARVGTSRLLPEGLSRIEMEIIPRGLAVQAYHTFPEERAIVRVQSLFEFRPAAPRR